MPDPKATEAAAAAAGLATPQTTDLISGGDDAIRLNARFTADALTEAAAAARSAELAGDTAAAVDTRTTGLTAGDLDRWAVRDQTGRTALGVTPAGVVQVAGTDIEPAPAELRIMDREGRISFWAKSDGTVVAPGLTADTAEPAPSRVVLLLGMGQSNMEGRARPYGPALDPADPRVLMWDWASAALAPATVPLSSRQQQTGLSVLTVVARQILATEPPGTTVVILNAGVGNTGLSNTTTTAGVWAVDYTGPYPALFSTTMAAYDAARAAVTTRYGVAPEVRVFWHQGEADSNATAYPAALDALIDATRAHIGAEVPFTLGGIVPEYITANPTRAPIRAAQLDAPARKTTTGYADGIPNGGGSASVTDVVHYARAGAEALGAAMHAAYRRALANVTGSVPVPPLTVTAELAGGTLAASWSPAFCRVTGYAAEYSTDAGTTWAPFPARTAALETTATAAGITGPALVRVATINDAGTSAPTAPITAGD